MSPAAKRGRRTSELLQISWRFLLVSVNRSVALFLVCALLGASESGAAERLTWSTDSTQPARFVAVHGRRSAIFGYSEHGLEVWAYPLQVVDSFGVAFRKQGGTTEIDGRAVLRRMEYSPEAVTRIYVGPDFIVREKLFVPLSAIGATGGGGPLYITITGILVHMFLIGLPIALITRRDLRQ